MDVISRLFVFLYTRLINRLERKMGYTLKFEHIPKTWIDGWMTFDMKESWLKQGIIAEGVNYFTMGSLENGTSSRFIRNKKQYQSWLGAYLVKFKENRKFTLQDHYDLAVADQKNWLEDFGDPHPYIKMSERNTAKATNIKLGKYQGKLYEFLGGPSHSDVGKRSNSKRNKVIMSLMAAMFNKCNPKLNLKSNNFIPKDLSTSYETVTLRGYIAVIDLKDKVKAMLYGNGAIIHDRKSKDIDYCSLLNKDILKAFRSVKITKVQ